jgi:putative transposase
LYDEPVEASTEELALMRRIGMLYLERPYYGSRRMTVALRQEG